MPDEIDLEFEQVWETAELVFKNDKQDARYFWLKGRQYELAQRQVEIAEMLAEVTKT
jgi:hypothetical protein